jgi:hypothetical protein
MTVAPWLNAPGSSIGAVLAKKDAASLRGGGVNDARDAARMQRITASCYFAASVFGAEECAAVAAALGPPQLAPLALAAQLLCDALCSVGANHPPGAPARPGDAAAPLGAWLPQESEPAAARALKAALAKLYLGFEALRAYIRRALAAHLLATLRAAGPGLPAGAAAALELLAGIARGLRRPLAPRHVRELLGEALLPLHGAGGMADDLTPVLGLIHRPLVRPRPGPRGPAARLRRPRPRPARSDPAR